MIISDIGKCRQSFEAMKVSFVRRSEDCVAKNAVRGSGVRTGEFCPPSWWLSPLGPRGVVMHSPHYTCSTANSIVHLGNGRLGFYSKQWTARICRISD
ncbi:hypothetical protein RHMOL_Rhmol11G0104500 [Rhododendron molle]|uniref:Uncharacterized protein n=1 Tax=Rhododendron molle TaxID=49168 RepID=A0ACC0LQV7_RHOML|nr:hypothetical protein RHMOL_Rhmol11G0104500 [Rhododendron molle]